MVPENRQSHAMEGILQPTYRLWPHPTPFHMTGFGFLMTFLRRHRLTSLAVTFWITALVRMRRCLEDGRMNFNCKFSLSLEPLMYFWGIKCLDESVPSFFTMFCSWAIFQN
jgi:hypothetical protein